MSNIKMKEGIIPFKIVKQKPLKYYINILANYNKKFFKYALYDIFFCKIKVCILITGFMKNANLTIENYFKLLPNYEVDFYLLTYDILEPNSIKKFNVNEFIEKFPIKKYLIREYSSLKKISENELINELYFNSFDMFEIYNQLTENYFFYIHTRPNLIFTNLNKNIEDNFTYIINNKILLHCFNDTASKITLSGFAICNIMSAFTYFNFHKYIEKYVDNIEEATYNYLVDSKIDVIQENICTISNLKPPQIPTRIAILRRGK